MDPEVEEIQNNIEEIKSRLSSQSIDKKTRRTLTDQAAALESLLLSKKSLPMNASLQVILIIFDFRVDF